MGNLAELYARQGRYEEAVRLATELRDIIRRVLGEQHPYTLRMMSEVVVLNRKLERDNAVCEALVIEFSARRDAQGMQHPLTLRAMRYLAMAYAKVGRDDERLALYRQALAQLPSTPGQADASRHALFTVAWILTRDNDELQDPVRAVEFARRAVELAEAENARNTYRMLDLLAAAHHQSGDTAAAVETQRRAIDALPERVSPDRRTAYEARLSTYQDAVGAE
jgi:tetratricopeptide (TPR) repeat protein